jgi:transposase
MRTPTEQQTRTFGTTTEELLALGEWLVAVGVTHVAMESTGVYWQPVYNLLEALELQVLVVNTQHIKATTAEYPHWQH